MKTTIHFIDDTFYCETESFSELKMKIFHFTHVEEAYQEYYTLKGEKVNANSYLKNPTIFLRPNLGGGGCLGWIFCCPCKCIGECFEGLEGLCTDFDFT